MKHPSSLINIKKVSWRKIMSWSWITHHHRLESWTMILEWNIAPGKDIRLRGMWLLLYRNLSVDTTTTTHVTGDKGDQKLLWQLDQVMTSGDESGWLSLHSPNHPTTRDTILTYVLIQRTTASCLMLMCLLCISLSSDRSRAGRSREIQVRNEK